MWEDELKKEIEDKTLLDFDELDWQVLISFIKLQLKKQRKKIIKEQKELCWRNASVLCEYNKNVLEVYVDRGSILNAPEPGGSE